MEPLPPPGTISRRPAEDHWNTTRIIRANEPAETDINLEERMPGSEEESVLGPRSTPASPKPPASPRPAFRTRTPPPPTRITDEEMPPLVPVVEAQSPDDPRQGFTVEWTSFPPAPGYLPPPPYHLWHPTNVLFEYLHVRGFLNTGRFEDDGDYPVVPASVVDLCEWFNNTTRETCQRQRGVWKEHKIRVEWLGWYWEERELKQAKAFQKRDDLMMRFVRFMEEKEMRERDIREQERREQQVERGDGLRLLAEAAERVQEEEDEEDKMDLDTDPEVVEQDDFKENGINMENGNGDIENGNHRMGNGYQDRRTSTSTEEDTDDESSRRETVTVNHVGEEDPKGLTPRDWDHVETLEDALEIKEDASMEEMVRETVSWAVDVHETGEFAKREQNQEDQEDRPVNRRTRQVSWTRYDVPAHTRDR
ncbi:MAG: hypothetical protein Q9168_003720 [Polycauliona sp. 1 TL-2023]